MVSGDLANALMDEFDAETIEKITRKIERLADCVKSEYRPKFRLVFEQIVWDTIAEEEGRSDVEFLERINKKFSAGDDLVESVRESEHCRRPDVNKYKNCRIVHNYYNNSASL